MLIGAQGVNLVHDDVRDAAEGVARLRGQQQVQRFRRRDEDVRRLADQALPLGGRRVAGADRRLDHGQRQAHLARSGGDAF